jgi:hypothetical protein
MKIAGAFDSYKPPKDSVECRCHVLREKEQAALMDFLTVSLPDCYITKVQLQERIKATGKSASALLANKTPDPGNVMSGDFGEILTLFFLGSERDEKVTLIKKWLYKQDRTKPAPHSDVVVLYREFDNKSSAKDFVINAETKQKSTKGTFAPIAAAIGGLEKDQTGRLARTLAWLREKAMDHGSKQEITFIERFTHDLSIAYAKHYKAVAIIDLELVKQELTRKPSPAINGSFEVIVIGIKDLKAFYEAVFDRAVKEVKV